MGFQWSQKNVSPIGVDLGSDSVKLLQVQADEPPRLIAAAAADIPTDARRDADSYRQFVVTAIKDLLRTAKFKGKRAVVSLNAAHTYVQHVRLPRGEEGELPLAIETELRGRLPLDPALMVIRHVPVGDVFADGANKQELICFGASRDWIMRCVQMLKQAGLDVVGMHAEPMAILAAFGHLFRRAGDEQRTTLFLDMGAATTKALIAHGKQLVFAKTIHVGGDHFTRQFATARSMNPADARIARVKQSLDTATAAVAPQPKPGELQMPVSRDRRQAAALPTGFALLDAVAPKSDTADTQMQTATAVAEPEAHASALGGGEVLETLIEELQLCVGYHRSMFQERPVEKIVFLGGESRFTDICQRIAQSLHVPAQLGDPLARLIRPQGCATPTGVDLRQSQPGWAVPMGLCLLPTNL